MTKRFYNYLLGLCLAVIGFLPISAFAQENTDQIVPTILMASPTSATEQSTSIICLLDKNCDGAWQPQTKDGAVNEGFGFQFEQPFQLDYIMITVTGNSEGLAFTAYLDGKDTIIDDTDKDSDPVRIILQRFEIDSKKAVYVLRRDPYSIINKPLTLDYSAKSVFFRIIDGNSLVKWTVTSIDIVNKNIFEIINGEISLVKDIYNDPHNLAVNLPIEVPLIALNATSILDPQNAYHPSHLFDSNTSMAFATDGKKGNGIGTKIALNFKNQQNIAGVMMWNGYQRSDKHFYANSRVKDLLINGEKIAVKDEQAIQKVMLAKPITNSQIVLEIADIYEGQDHKDVVLSELHFIDNKGAIILPLTQETPLLAELTNNHFVDRSFSGFLSQMVFARNEVEADICDVGSFRLRSNGSFSLYSQNIKGIDRLHSFAIAAEGNFEIIEHNKFKLFGKKYQTMFSRMTGYLKENEDNAPIKVAPSIFQGLFTIEKFSDLSEKEQKDLLSLLINEPLYEEPEKIYADQPDFNIGLFVSLDQGFVVEAATISEVREKLRKILLTKEVYAVKSDIYTDLVVPVDRVPFCTKI
ncbi:hypothetical protein [Bartonella sp. HY038]|uniref:NADase-type glycan-binding domain-containing protein n=1 Tax=Bartonella sp. HY038 TaxID=2759660 RepID=UPI0015FE5AA3|nr:hypothetical protein [Bartonella sp. HY038]